MNRKFNLLYLMIQISGIRLGAQANRTGFSELQCIPHEIHQHLPQPSRITGYFSREHEKITS